MGRGYQYGKEEGSVHSMLRKDNLQKSALHLKGNFAAHQEEWREIHGDSKMRHRSSAQKLIGKWY